MSELDTRIDRRWHGLYLAGGAAALITAALIPLQMVALIVWTPPFDGTIEEWFSIFQSNPLRGLVSFDLLMMVEEGLVIAIVLALWVHLHRSSESLVALAAGAWLVGAGLFVASNTGFEMLALANRFAAASGDAASVAARQSILAAGQAMLATYWDKGTAFYAGYVLTSLAGIGIGVAMLRDRSFGRATGWSIVVANVLGFGLFVPVVGVALSLVSVLVLWAWYVLAGWRLVRLVRQPAATAAMPVVPAPAASR